MTAQPEQGGNLEREATLSSLVNAARSKKEDGYSWQMASAIVFIKEGRELLGEVEHLTGRPGSSNISPDPHDFYEHLSPPIQAKAMRGLGLVTVGLTALTIEAAKKYEWRDIMYVGSYSENTKDIAVAPPIERYPVTQNEVDETIRIRAIAQQDDGTLSLFLENDNHLPALVRWHLTRLQPGVRRFGFKEASSLYIETNKRLLEGEVYSREVPDPVEKFMEEVRRQAFLAEMDDLATDHDKRARKLLESIKDLNLESLE